MSNIQALTSQEQTLAALIVSTLNLDVASEQIEAEAPLYKDGLGLDSIDILEIALAISKTYGFQIKSDDSDNVRIFTSLRSLNQHIEANRTK